MRYNIFLILRTVAVLLLGVFALVMSGVAPEGNMAFAGGAAFVLLPLGLRPYERTGAANDERRNLHEVLGGCPVGVAIVAHGRLCFANAVFTESTHLATGAEELRIAFDATLPEAGHTDLNGKNAMLFWNAADGNEYRMRLVARLAPYGGEEAFFLWLTGLADDAVQHAARLFEASGQAMPDPAPSVAPSARSKARVLLAEDNEINQQIATELLAHVGVEVEVASNGQEAVELFLREDFDLILMDIQMPVMDGTDATRAIRTSGKTGADTVPILAMTAHAMSSDRDKSLNAGMNDHLIKPIDPQLLYKALDTWLPEHVRAVAGESASAPEPVPAPPSEMFVPPATGGPASPPQAAAPAEEPRQDILFSLKGFHAQAGLSNVAGNRELYLRLLDRFAKHYRNSGAELRDALQRAEHDASAHAEAVRVAHTAKGVAANLGARTLAAVAGDLESVIKKKETVQEAMLARYELLLREAVGSIESLPKRDDVSVGQQAVSVADKGRLADVLVALPDLMQTDWYGAQQKLLALAPIVEGTVASAHFREITMALEEFDNEGVAEKGKLLLAAI